jgi:hypothetical protein
VGKRFGAGLFIVWTRIANLVEATTGRQVAISQNLWSGRGGFAAVKSDQVLKQRILLNKGLALDQRRRRRLYPAKRKGTKCVITVVSCDMTTMLDCFPYRAFTGGIRNETSLAGNQRRLVCTLVSVASKRWFR